MNYRKLGKTNFKISEIQVYSNLSAGDLPKLSDSQRKAIDDIYEQYIKESVHQLW